jgi:C4-dicarboxylate transporter DctQ subunit
LLTPLHFFKYTSPGLIMKMIERAIQLLGSALDHVTRLLWLVSGAMILLMAFVTGYGVVMRYIFNNPDPYAYEITYILMLSCIVFSLAYTQRLGRHLRIDILDHYFSETMREVLNNILVPIIGLTFCIPIVWKTLEKALFALQSGQMSGTTGIPVSPMMFTIPIGAGLLCLVLIVQILSYLASTIGKGKT